MKFGFENAFVGHVADNRHRWTFVRCRDQFGLLSDSPKTLRTGRLAKTSHVRVIKRHPVRRRFAFYRFILRSFSFLSQPFTTRTFSKNTSTTSCARVAARNIVKVVYRSPETSRRIRPVDTLVSIKTMTDDDALAVDRHAQKWSIRENWPRCRHWLQKTNEYSHAHLLAEFTLFPKDWHDYLRVDRDTRLQLFSLVTSFIQKKKKKMRNYRSRPREILSYLLLILWIRLLNSFR